MKKVISALLAFVLAFSFASVSFAAETDESEFDSIAMDFNKETENVYIRDPFVLLYGNRYYMYGTGASTVAGYGCYVSEDLKHWAGPFNVFDAAAQQNFDGVDNYWAPECHYYKGSFYIFATYKSGTTGHRGCTVLKSDSPLGPFTEISDGHITPEDWDSIDGTLYIDKNGEPWMVFVHEWTSMPDEIGDMCYAKLSDDLSHFTTEPVKMFKATDPFWSTSRVTDGPFMYRTSDDNLIMIWSNGVSKRGYGVGVAKSSNGEINGEWKHEAFPLYTEGKLHDYDGGHGMLFTSKDGKLFMAIHTPNSSSEENMTHAEFFEIEDTGKSIVIKADKGTRCYFWERVRLLFVFSFEKVRYFFKHLFK